MLLCSVGSFFPIVGLSLRGCKMSNANALSSFCGLEAYMTILAHADWERISVDTRHSDALTDLKCFEAQPWPQGKRCMTESGYGQM